MGISFHFGTFLCPLAKKQEQGKSNIYTEKKENFQDATITFLLFCPQANKKLIVEHECLFF